jgi:hypothetical protein
VICGNACRFKHHMPESVTVACNGPLPGQGASFMGDRTQPCARDSLRVAYRPGFGQFGDHDRAGRQGEPRGWSKHEGRQMLTTDQRGNRNVSTDVTREGGAATCDRV